jgi:ribosomal protein S18 acetylase RimI-like enzyme
VIADANANRRDALTASSAEANHPSPMLHLRQAHTTDRQLLRTLLFEAAFWRPNAARPELDEALAAPELRRYLDDFGRRGDLGIIAEEDGYPRGAAWWRCFSRSSPGYGFIDEATPEISIAVEPGHRQRGIGTALLHALHDQARTQRIDRLSLSVERDNPAVALYRRVGYQTARTDQFTFTMLIELARAPAAEDTLS